MLISLIIAIISIVVNFVIVPIVYPLFVHYEKLAYYILRSFNKLTKKFVENELRCCNELFMYIGKKQGSGVKDKKTEVMMKKPEARKENKQLMKVNPKIPKHLLEQKKKRREEEKESLVVVRVEPVDDEDDMLLDEELDEQDHHSARRNRHRQRRGDNSGIVAENTASMTSIDESTVRTSVEANSSTNKSSRDEHTSEDQGQESDDASSSSVSNYTHYTNVSQWKAYKQSQFGDQAKSNGAVLYDITQAKPSELAGDHYVEKDNQEMTDEERELKRIVRERQRKIK